MRPCDVLGKKWGRDIDEKMIRDLTDADTIDVVPYDTIYDLGFVGGRVRIFIADDDTIVCLLHEKNDGKFVRMWAAMGTPVC